MLAIFLLAIAGASYILSIFAAMGLDMTAGFILGSVISVLFPLTYIISLVDLYTQIPRNISTIALPFLYIFNFIYIYLLSDLLYSLFRKQKVSKIALIIVLLLLISGFLSHYIHEKNYWPMQVELMRKQREEGPYGSAKYSDDVVQLNWIRGTTGGNNLYKELLSDCYTKIKPEATFNNGESIQKKCVSELEARKNDMGYHPRNN